MGSISKDLQREEITLKIVLDEQSEISPVISSNSRIESSFCYCDIYMKIN